MTKGNYRKKALPFLLADFEKHCAYCLDPNDFRHPSLDQVDHFNCKLKNRHRHKYKNLMLACAACNFSKHDKPTVNPFDKEQRLLNCTEENEFLQHVVECEDGQWEALTKAGKYHLESINLREPCHKNKRSARRKIVHQILEISTMAIHYQSHNPFAVHNQLMNTLYDLVELVASFPPMVTQEGVVAAKKFLVANGVNLQRPASVV